MEKHLPLRVKIGFGAASLANITWIAFVTFGLIFFTDVAGVAPALAGSIFSIGLVWDAITSPLIGNFSDQINIKGERRRPFLLMIAVPFAIVSWLLFTNWGFSPNMTFVYCTFMTMMFYTSFNFFDVPYSSLGAEITQDYDERVSLNSWRVLFTQIACVVGASCPLLLVNYFEKALGTVSLGWSATGAVFGLLCIPGFIIAWRATKGREIIREKGTKAESASLKEMWGAVLSNRPLLYVLGMFGFGIMSISMWTAMTTYYYYYYMQTDDMTLSFIYFLSGACGALFIPIINLTAKKISKKASWIINMGFFGIVNTIGLGWLLGPGEYGLAYLLAILGAGGQMVAYQIGWSMIADCVEVDELKTGYRREGIIYGFVTLVQKCGDAAMMFVMGMSLQVIGYVANTVQSADAILGIRMLNGPGVGILVVISIIFAAFSPMTRERHRALCSIIRLKEEGKAYDLTPIKALMR